MSMMIGGDVVPTQANLKEFSDGDITRILGEDLSSVWLDSEFRVFNLEVPLVDEHHPIDKFGPVLSAPTTTINGVKALNPSLVTIANNHIFDHGIEGLRQTINLLKSNKIPFIGAGFNLFEAERPQIIELNNGKKIGLYACAEHEFSIATEDGPGANPFDPLESLDHIVQLKKQCDYVVVLYHGGKENYRYPSPHLQKACRKMVEKGATLVICQHSHCVGCFEEYEGSTIVYGQGNFIFNKYNNEYWNNSLLIKVDFTDRIEIEYIPVVRTEIGVRLARHREAEELLSTFYSRSEEIQKQGVIEERYREFANERIQQYLRTFSGQNKWISRIDRYLFNGLLLKKKYSKKQLLGIRNYIECEAHRELVLMGLKGDYVVENK